MKLNYSVFSLVVVAFLTTSCAADEDAEKVEESTKSPIEEQMQVTEVEMKTSTDRPPTSTSTEMSKNTKEEQPQSPELTVANYVIHPLIALKTKTTADDISIGKQATTSISPWTIFGFNPGQSFGSLAGSVTGWINHRIPSFVETPVRDSSTTTTPRSEVIAHPTHNPNRKRPNRLDYYEVEEGDDYDDEDNFEYEEDDGGQESNYPANNRIRPKFGGPNEDDEEIDDEYDDEDDDIVSEIEQRPNNRLRPGQNNQDLDEQQKRYLLNLQRQKMFANKRRLQQAHQFQYDDGLDENFFYDGYPSMKSAQNEMGFIQHGQQHLMNQLLQQRSGQASRKPQQAAKQRRKQATVMDNRNEQPVEPELPKKGGAKLTFHNSNRILPQQSVMKKRVQPSMLQQSNSQPKPQPQSEPLSAQLPLKRKNRPAQYIAIPWSQLGMDPTRGLQSFGLQAFGINSPLKPIILNIPQSAIDQIQKANKNKRPLRADELQILPLLIEDPLMKPMMPAKVKPSRINVITTKKPKVVTTTENIVMKPIALSMTNVPPRRVRPGTMVENAPADTTTMNEPDESDNGSPESAPDSHETNGSILRKNRVPNIEREFIVIGDDDEPGIIRQVQPVYGNERLLQARVSPYFELRTRQQKAGRALEGVVEAAANHEEIQQKIPVEIVYEEKLPEHQSLLGVQPESIES